MCIYIYILIYLYTYTSHVIYMHKAPSGVELLADRARGLAAEFRPQELKNKLQIHKTANANI